MQSTPPPPSLLLLFCVCVCSLHNFNTYIAATFLHSNCKLFKITKVHPSFFLVELLFSMERGEGVFFLLKGPLHIFRHMVMAPNSSFLSCLYIVALCSTFRIKKSLKIQHMHQFLDKKRYISCHLKLKRK